VDPVDRPADVADPPGPDFEQVLGGDVVKVLAGMQDDLRQHDEGLLQLPALHAALQRGLLHLGEKLGADHRPDVGKQGRRFIPA
jgi:hypothetical protein